MIRKGCFFAGIFLLLQEPVWAAGLNLQDPTQPVNYRGNGREKFKKSGDFLLEAIIVSGDYKVVIIDGKILKVGDYLGTKKIVFIDETKVILRQEKEKDLILKRSNTSIKEVSK
jgi:hypothetical protein